MGAPMMVMVRRRWRGHRAMVQPGWHTLGPMTERAAEAEALTCRLHGHDVEVVRLVSHPAQVPMFGMRSHDAR